MEQCITRMLHLLGLHQEILQSLCGTPSSVKLGVPGSAFQPVRPGGGADLSVGDLSTRASEREESVYTWPDEETPNADLNFGNNVSFFCYPFHPELSEVAGHRACPHSTAWI